MLGTVYDSIVQWIDGHIDLAFLTQKGRNVLDPCEDPQVACISIPDLEKSSINTFFGTIYTSPDDPFAGYGSSDDREAAFEVGSRQLNQYIDLEKRGCITMQHSGCTVSAALSMLLLMEGADPIRHPEDVLWWKDQGLRIVGLTWATGTRYAGGNNSGGPLTIEGKELVAALDQAGIVHDVSHLSDTALDDLFACATGQMIASHSNSRTVLCSDSQRHLRDDQAIELLQRGGVIGLNLCNQFLSRDFMTNNHRASIHDCVLHVLHFCDLAGNRRQVALGSDFDGGFTPQFLPDGLKHPNQLHHLVEALVTVGFDDDDIASFTHGAWMKVLGTA